MSGAVILLGSLFLLGMAYIFYGRWVARKFGIDDSIITPAHRLRDDGDYMPARAPVLLGHHFASIAGAAPIIGPVSAAVFGWVPVLLWLVFGGIFFGAMHDFAALVVSIRNDGKSIGEVIKKHVGARGSVLFLLFVWFTLALVIAAFAIIVGKTFNAVPAAASSSVMFIGLAVVFGLALNRFNFSLGIATVIGVILLLAMIWLGQLYPLQASEPVWLYLLLAYIYVASVAPVWLLLQPRDYLNSFLLYILLLGGFIGMLFYNPEIVYPAFTAIKTESLGYLFPMLFVTVACGAISGFHSLVASGTTAKQLNVESDAQPVAFGGMLIETFLGILALLTAVTLSSDAFAADLAAKGPVGVFAGGMAGAIAAIPGISFKPEVLVSFVSLIVSAFALTSLDTATRLGRFAFQELAEFMPEKLGKPCKNKHIATVLTILPAAALMFTGQWKAIWPLFGSANQLLASIALLSIAVWFYHRFKVRPVFVMIPMLVMFLVTCFALINLIDANIARQGYLLAALSGVLLILAIFLAWEAAEALRRKLES